MNRLNNVGGTFGSRNVAKGLAGMLVGACGRAIVLAAAVVPIALTTQSAVAQPGGGRGGFGGGMRDMGQTPALTTRQIEKYAQMLAMSDDQKDALTTLHDGYREATDQIGDKMRKAMEDVRAQFEESRDPSVWGSIREKMEVFRDERKKVDDGFMNDMKSLLNEGQTTKFVSVERAMRRDQTLRRGVLSGERVDLFEVVETRKLSPEMTTTVQPALVSYEEELDRALTARNTAYENAMKQFGEMMQTGDFEKAQDVMNGGREAAVKVRDINRKYAKQIAEMLPEDQRPGFNDEFRRRSFPDVYRPSMATRSIEAAEGFADLSPEQLEQVRSIKSSFDKTMNGLNDKLSTAVEEGEMTFNVQDAFQRGGAGQEGPAADLRRERRELNEKTLADLKKILNAEQAERLPKAEEGGRGGGEGGGQRRQRNQRRPMDET